MDRTCASNPIRANAPCGGAWIFLLFSPTVFTAISHTMQSKVFTFVLRAVSRAPPKLSARSLKCKRGDPCGSPLFHLVEAAGV